MPKIPVITAEGQAPRLNISNRSFPFDSHEGDKFLAESLKELGDTTVKVGVGLAHQEALNKDRLAKLGEKLQAEQDRLVNSKISGLYDAGLTNIIQQLSELEPNPDPQKRMKVFRDEAKKLYENLTADPTLSNNALRMFQQHTYSKYPHIDAQVLGEVRKNYSAGQVAELHNTLELLSDEAAMNPVFRADYEKAGIDLVQPSIHFPDEKAKVTTINKFLGDIQEKQMKIAASAGAYDHLVMQDMGGDFNRVPVDKRIAIMDSAKAKAHQEQTRLHQDLVQKREEETQKAWKQANNGTLDPITLENNPWIHDSNKPSILAHSEDPVFGGTRNSNRLVIDSLAARWSTGEQTPELAKKYIKELDKLRVDLAPLNKKDLERLTTIGEMIHSNSRSERTVAQSENTINIHNAQKAFDAAVEPHKPGEDNYNVKYKNEIKQNKAEIDVRCYGKSKEECQIITKEVIDRFLAKKKAKPPDAVDRLNKNYMGR